MEGNVEEFRHESVMPREVVDALCVADGGTYVDCTLGGAGHSLRIARMLTTGRVIGIDRDDAALRAARERLKAFSPGIGIDIVKGNFADLSCILAKLNVSGADGVLFDLGVSSHQIDTAERGFSYMHDAPLDMRMDRAQELTAQDVINDYAEEDLARIFREYGEERFARRAARLIADERRKKRIVNAAELVQIIERAVPKTPKGGHPAKRIFQAIRIEVNDELSILEDAFKAAANCLKVGGRLAIITFHSLEDRIAKNTLRELATNCICPPKQPVCTCHHKATLKIIGKVKEASEEEIKNNPRAKSAKLRVAEKIQTA